MFYFTLLAQPDKPFLCRVKSAVSDLHIQLLLQIQLLLRIQLPLRLQPQNYLLNRYIIYALYIVALTNTITVTITSISGEGRLIHVQFISNTYTFSITVTTSF